MCGTLVRIVHTAARLPMSWQLLEFLAVAGLDGRPDACAAEASGRSPHKRLHGKSGQVEYVSAYTWPEATFTQSGDERLLASLSQERLAETVDSQQKVELVRELSLCELAV